MAPWDERPPPQKVSGSTEPMTPAEWPFGPGSVREKRALCLLLGRGRRQGGAETPILRTEGGKARLHFLPQK